MRASATNKTANAPDSPAIPSPPPESCHLSPCPPIICWILSSFVLLLLINSVSPSLHMLWGASDSFFSAVWLLWLPFPTLLCLEQHLSGKQQGPLPPASTLCCSHTHCSCPCWSSYPWEPKQDLSILSCNPHVCCNPSPLFYLLLSCTCSPQPFNSPIERRWLDRNPRKLTLTCLGPIATREMWHHVSSASACKGMVNVKIILQIEIQQQPCLWLDRAVRRAPSCLLAHLLLSRSWGQPAWFRGPWSPPGP